MASHWWKQAKIYELYVSTFAGTFVGLTERLDYFTQLGITCIHLLPHYPSAMIDDGYDITDYRGVRSELGTLEECIRFIEEAHARDIKVIIDFVLNHTSDQHPWFVEARSSRENPKRDFYLWSKDATKFAGATNAFPDIKSQNWIPNIATDDLYFTTFYPQQPDLNWDNPEVFDAMLSNMEFWAERGVDGFRLDAVSHLIKKEGTSSKGLPETHATIKRIRARLEAMYPEVILLAEAAQSIKTSKEYFGDGDECHMVYNFPIMERLWLTLVDGTHTRLDAAIAESADIPDNCAWGTFLGNHDQLSLGMLTPAERQRIIDALDPRHEYPFNKRDAISMRVASALQGDKAKILEVFKLLYSTPGTPIMYYGDEIGMKNLPLEHDFLDTRRYVRGMFDWDAAQAQAKDPDSLLNETARIISQAKVTTTPQIQPEIPLETPLAAAHPRPE
jgi:maltose alpha-D-glucosyltransferase/alpha-amylase